MANHKSYILNGWENKDLWVLNNAEWIETAEEHLKINNNGYVYREVINTYNIDWKLTIYDCFMAGKIGWVTRDIRIFLNGDPNPIIFRLRHYISGNTEYIRIWSIIYDGDIKAQISDELDPLPYSPACNFYYGDDIWKVGSIYYYLGLVPDPTVISFDYGSIKKPVKIKLNNLENPSYTKWVNLQWYYTASLGDAIIF